MPAIAQPDLLVPRRISCSIDSWDDRVVPHPDVAQQIAAMLCQLGGRGCCKIFTAAIFKVGSKQGSDAASAHTDRCCSEAAAASSPSWYCAGSEAWQACCPEG